MMAGFGCSKSILIALNIILNDFESLKDTFKTWTLMETIVSVVGLIGVFILNYFVH